MSEPFKTRMERAVYPPLLAPQGEPVVWVLGRPVPLREALAFIEGWRIGRVARLPE